MFVNKEERFANELKMVAFTFANDLKWETAFLDELKSFNSSACSNKPKESSNDHCQRSEKVANDQTKLLPQKRRSSQMESCGGKDK